VRLGQSQQVSLGRQDRPETVAERRAQIAGLASLLGDDQNRHGAQPELNPLLLQRGMEEYPGAGLAQPTEGDPLPCRQITAAPRRAETPPRKAAWLAFPSGASAPHETKPLRCRKGRSRGPGDHQAAAEIQALIETAKSELAKWPPTRTSRSSRPIAAWVPGQPSTDGPGQGQLREARHGNYQGMGATAPHKQDREDWVGRPAGRAEERLAAQRATARTSMDRIRGVGQDPTGEGG
jgi:hypothetical protein